MQALFHGLSAEGGKEADEGLSEIWADLSQRLPIPSPEESGACYDLWFNSLLCEAHDSGRSEADQTNLLGDGDGGRERTSSQVSQGDGSLPDLPTDNTHEPSYVAAARARNDGRHASRRSGARRRSVGGVTDENCTLL